MEGRAELSTFHVPESRIAPTADIVAVHGLEAGKSASSSGARPFTEFLVHDIPTARIFNFAYDHSQSVYVLATDLLRALSKARDESHTVSTCPNYQMESRTCHLQSGQNTRPLIFVAHSFGGLVVKAALSEEASHSDEGALSCRTVGIVFVSTPHRGDSSGVRSFLQNLESCFLKQSVISFHPDLRRAREVEDVQATFQVTLGKNLQHVELVSFYEELPSWGNQVVRLPWFAR
jgi:hypothetical protein